MSKKAMIMALGGVVLLFSMMGGGFFMMWQKMNASIAQIQSANDKDSKGHAAKEEEEVVKPTYKMETMIVNLADQGGKRYLRVTMEMELSGPEVLEEITKKLPQLRDTILMILPSKQYTDISTTEGKIAVRDELIAKINTLLKKGTVTTIFFTEFVVQ
ncbi:MAG: flagellar basal body-associated FliL family protein [Desulfobacterales bacterium]|nr:flagellar basal body-associated FliL family protein [Desulfobacterales bacterium]